MVGIIAAVLLLISIIFSIINHTENIYDIFFSGASDSISFCLKTGGIICLFCGIMNVAKKAGITETISKILYPVLKRLIPNIQQNPEAQDAVCMNIASNMLGLGTAATPFGIRATNHLMNGRTVPDLSVATFIILNTASIQLFPTTIAAILQANGSSEPFAILPAVLISQFTACITGILFIRLFYRNERRL